VFVFVVADTIEANVTVAHDRVDEGREELLKAAAYQASCSFLLPADILILSQLRIRIIRIYCVWPSVL